MKASKNVYEQMSKTDWLLKSQKKSFPFHDIATQS
jgi:hypothetical protein